MPENNPLDPVQSFFFANAPAGSPLSYQSLQTRRKIAEALLSKRTALPFPKNLGEGLTYASDRLANAFDDRTMLDRLDAAERERQAQLDKFAAGPVPGSGDVPNIPASGRPQASTEEGGDTQTSASGVPPVPYAPSGEGSVPLPPPRPVVDRSPIINDANDPATARRLAAITLGEGNPGASEAELQQQYESTVNRGMQVGLPNAIKTYTGPGSGGYYPPDAIARGEQRLQQPGAYESFRERIARPILRGATDPLGLGFSPTQNASLGVASRGAANGTYSQFARSPTGELFARKPGDRPPTPFPTGGPDLGGPDVAGTPPDATEQGRNAITGAVLAGAQPPIPNARVASLGGGGPLGNAGAASSVIPPTLPPTTPPAPFANPPIPTDIAPRPPQVAQARPSGIPGPLTPPTPTPTPPPAPGTPQGFRPPPPAPVLDTRPTPEEVHGIRMLRQYPDDPAFAAEAQRWIAAGQAKRQAAFEQQKENHKNLMEDWKLGQAAAIAQQNPAEQLKLQEARQEAQRKQAEYEHFAGQTLEQAKAPVVESYKEASKLPAIAMDLRNAKQMVSTDPKMFTGRTADIQLELSKWAAAAGLPLNPKVAPTEAFKSYITGVVGQLRPLVVGAGAQSNYELQFLQKAAGADAKLERKSIESILNSVEKLTTMAAIEHQKKLLTFTGDDPNRQRAFGGYNVMENVVPQAAVSALREHAKEDPAAAAKEFDEYYYTPGLAAKILRSGR